MELKTSREERDGTRPNRFSGEVPIFLQYIYSGKFLQRVLGHSVRVCASLYACYVKPLYATIGPPPKLYGPLGESIPSPSTSLLTGSTSPYF